MQLGTKRYSEGELQMMEEMDANIYASTRNTFEHLLHMTLSEVDPEKRAKNVKVLIDTYNGTSESAQRLMGQVRRLENG